MAATKQETDHRRKYFTRFLKREWLMKKWSSPCPTACQRKSWSDTRSQSLSSHRFIPTTLNLCRYFIC